MLNRDFFHQTPLVCARALIGSELRWGNCAGLVVEAEAYAAVGDEACHTFLRKGARDFVEKHPAGTAYVYLNYGVHWMLNVVVKSNHTTGFVLIRALQPVAGIELMKGRRKGVASIEALCSGPGKLAQALGINRAHHGFDLTVEPQHAFHAREGMKLEVLSDVRVGISKAADLPWRFLQAGSRHVSVRHGKVRTHLTLTQRRALAAGLPAKPTLPKNAKSQAG